MLQFGPLPVTMGHEIAGVLDDGSVVAVDPAGPCGECDQCAIGDYHLCRRSADGVLGIGRDGGMSDRMRRVTAGDRPARRRGRGRATRASSSRSRWRSTGLRLAGVGGGMRVAVVGAGSIGLAAVAATRATGCEVALERASRRPARRRRTARRGRCRPVSTTSSSRPRAPRARSPAAAELCRPSGTVLFLSTHWTPVPIPGMASAMKELAFRWSFMYGTHAGTRDLDSRPPLLAHDPEIAATLITHRFPLDDAAEAFRVAADRSVGRDQGRRRALSRLPGAGRWATRRYPTAAGRR